MSESEFTEALQDVLGNVACLDSEEAENLGFPADFLCAENPTFAQAGLLTGNHGLVMQLRDGSEFQITIVRSK